MCLQTAFNLLCYYILKQIKNTNLVPTLKVTNVTTKGRLIASIDFACCRNLDGQSTKGQSMSFGSDVRKELGVGDLDSAEAAQEWN